MLVHRIRIPIALVLVLGVAAAAPTGVPPLDWPVARFVANLNERLREAPDDASACYTLGRVHAFAFALERSTLIGRDRWVKDLAEQARSAPTLPPPTPEQMLEHLGEGVRHLRRACALQDSAQHRLTLAWLLETGAHLASRVDTVALFELSASTGDEGAEVESWIGALGSDDGAKVELARWRLVQPEKLEQGVPALQARSSSANAKRQRAVAALLERYWLERSISEYWHSFSLAMAGHLADERISIEHGKGLSSLVVSESLASYRRLIEARGSRTAEEEENLAQAAEQWKQLEKLPRGRWITPLLLCLEGRRTLEELVCPDFAVPFDLDGNGVDELWPWIAPQAGWLVWDPRRTGEITSGQQLFGSASAWLFFADGYRVLDALDDDRDGELRGVELLGIAVWFDRDSDGISDRGEVEPVEELGIAALSTEATERIGPSLGNPCGLELADGRRLPTYDWLLSAVEP